MNIKDASAQNVTPQELIEFFVDNQVSPKCPTCGNDHSAIQINDSGSHVRVLANEYVELKIETNSFTRITNMMYPTVLTTCDRCGYVRSFSLHKVNVWLNTKYPERAPKA